MLRFLFTNETKAAVQSADFGKTVAKFEKVLKERIEHVLKCKNGEVSLTIVDDQKIQSLNKDYRNKNKPTDVLSFAYVEDKKMRVFHGSNVQVGDIFISIDTAKKQAKDHSHSLKKELVILFTHGLLHLFGFDHNNDREENEMEMWAKKILEQII